MDDELTTIYLTGRQTVVRQWVSFDRALFEADPQYLIKLSSVVSFGVESRPGY